MALDVGKMDRRIRIERGATGDDGMNETRVWAELATCWAQFLPGHGAERFAAMAQSAAMPATWRIRYQAALADLAATDRLVEVSGGQPVGPVYDIKNVILLPRDGEIRIDATAGAA